jgi:hypothetical protein
MIEVIRSRMIERYLKLKGRLTTDYVMKGKWLYEYARNKK